MPDRIARRRGFLPAATRRDKLVVVHGGAEARAYRNVLEALEEGLACGADMFEFDVRRAGDGTLVVHHDPDIDGHPLPALDYADASRLCSRLGYALPRLPDVLAMARGRILLDVELKEGGAEAAVLAAVADAGFDHDEFVVTSFDTLALSAIHRLDSGVRTGLLLDDVTGAAALETFRRTGAAFLGPDHRILDDETLRGAALEGVRLLPWTVNDPAAIHRLFDAQAVAGIITDRATVAVRIRQSAEP